MHTAPHPTQLQQPYSLSSTVLIAVGVCEPPCSRDNCLVRDNTLDDGMGYREETDKHGWTFVCALWQADAYQQKAQHKKHNTSPGLQRLKEMRNSNSMCNYCGICGQDEDAQMQHLSKC